MFIYCHSRICLYPYRQPGVSERVAIEVDGLGYLLWGELPHRIRHAVPRKALFYEREDLQKEHEHVHVVPLVGDMLKLHLHVFPLVEDGLPQREGTAHSDAVRNENRSQLP